MNFFIRIQQITPSFVGSRVSDKTIRLAEPLGICGEHKEADNELESNYNLRGFSQPQPHDGKAE
jgi:hypothetical protein